MAIGDNLKRLREEHGLTQRELGRIAGVSDKAVSTWEKGHKAPRMSAITAIAEHFGIPTGDLFAEHITDMRRARAQSLSQLCTAWDRTPERVAGDLSLSMARVQQLMAGSEPTELEAALIASYFHTPQQVLRDGTAAWGSDFYNVKPVPVAAKSRRVPVLGRVPAGVPIEAVADVVEEIDLSDVQDGYDYFGLLVTGDSMVPEYRDGDVVILRMQATAQTGDDVVAYIGNADATLKRLTVTENGIQLRPLNPAYDVRSFTNEEIRSLPVTIAGIVTELRRRRRHV